MTGHMGLTPKQTDELNDLRNRDKKLTDRQVIRMAYLLERAGPVLGKTAEAVVHEAWLRKEYGRIKEIQSKYLDKGIEVEEDSITLVTKLTNQLYVKNQERKTDEWFTGECDIKNKDTVIDVKSSWDIHTFHKAECTHSNKWQVMCYMHLWKKEKGAVAYCLIDTPDHILNDEFRRTAWKLNIYDGDINEPKYDQLKYQIAKNMLFTDEAFKVAKSAYFPTADTSDWIPIPDELRIKWFDVEWQPEMIELAKERVKLANEFYETITL